jgi:hypothetical protein
MKTVLYGIPGLVPAYGLIGCGPGTSAAPASHLSLQLISSDSSGGATASKIEMRAAETRTVVLVAVGADGPATFSSGNLPPFATLDGPVLTLSPQRPDTGDYSLALTVTAGHDSATADVRLSVLRSNGGPTWAPSFNPILGTGLSDDLNGPRPRCPSPETCTLAPNSFLSVSPATGKETASRSIWRSFHEGNPSPRSRPSRHPRLPSTLRQRREIAPSSRSTCLA